MKEKKKRREKKTSERILGYFLSDWLSRVEHTIKASVSLLSLSLSSSSPSIPPSHWENANGRKQGEVWFPVIRELSRIGWSASAQIRKVTDP